jgi:acyl-CoA synthetase (AMP-forming)/AMP-acid ligase II
VCLSDVEVVLGSQPAVADSALVGVDAPEWGEEVHTFGVLSKMLPFTFVKTPPLYDTVEVFYLRIDPTIGITVAFIEVPFCNAG